MYKLESFGRSDVLLFVESTCVIEDWAAESPRSVDLDVRDGARHPRSCMSA